MDLPVSPLDLRLRNQSLQDPIHHPRQRMIIRQDLPPRFIQRLAVSLFPEPEFLLWGDDDETTPAGFLFPAAKVSGESSLGGFMFHLDWGSSYCYYVCVVQVDARDAQTDDNEVVWLGMLDKCVE